VYKIIVAEDVELILNSIIRNIQDLNMDFEIAATAENGKIALDLIDKLSPDVLITDIRMPVMNGLELLNTVSSQYPYIIKVVISGYDEFEYAQQALKYEVKDYLLKPLKKDELFDTLNRIKIYLDARRQNNKNQFMPTKEGNNYTTEQIVNMIIAFLKENYSQEINMDLIANEFKFNSSYLSKIFTKCTGENPSKYLMNLRINKAKNLLSNDKDLSIKDVGNLVGYPNQYYFSRIFKICTGKSPAKFRNEGF
jgi:two-component system, response regulator YesN